MVHLIATHIFAIGELSYDNIGERLAVTAVLVIDILLLAAVIYHGLNGVRMVLLDYGFKGRARGACWTRSSGSPASWRSSTASGPSGSG